MGYRSSHTNCIVRVLPLRGVSAQQEALCLFLREEAGRCWTNTLNAYIESWGGKWLSSSNLKKMFKGQYALHFQSVQALSKKLVANIDAARELRKTDPEAHYPYHPKKYQAGVWKQTAVRLQCNLIQKKPQPLPRLFAFLFRRSLYEEIQQQNKRPHRRHRESDGENRPKDTRRTPQSIGSTCSKTYRLPRMAWCGSATTNPLKRQKSGGNKLAGRVCRYAKTHT